MIWGNESSQKNKEILVRTVSNRIYFYTAIDAESTLEFNIQLSEIDRANVAIKINNDLDRIDPIYVYISSPGGYVHHGLSAMDSILDAKSDIITIVDGYVASAATFMSLAGRKRLMREHSYMLIHQIATAGGHTKHAELVDVKENMDELMNKLRSIYTKYTKIPMDKLDEILKHDLYFDAKTCLDYGLIDEIIKK